MIGLLPLEPVTMPLPPFTVRRARPDDVPELMRLKRLLAEGENALTAIRADAADWLRDGFGADAGFAAFVAEVADTIVAMATYSQRRITGWDAPVVLLQDLIVEPDHRERGIATALIARLAAFAREVDSPIIELTVRADNPARGFYDQAGFTPVPHCLTYVIAAPALAALAERDTLALTG